MSPTPPPPHRLFTFAAGATGPWHIKRIAGVIGAPLAAATRVEILAGTGTRTLGPSGWRLRGITSNERYVMRPEKDDLVGRQQGLGRSDSICAALIPIRKNALWWALTQDERREIFEAQSHHIALGMRALPAVARRLHHCRDLGPDEPFDFLTWFEYAPGDASAFEDLLLALRASPEWAYVEREVDIRLVLDR